jgi:hypothetical protein
MCSLLCITICKSDRITFTTTKILGLMFYDQPLLLHYMFYMNTIVIELLIWIHISEHRIDRLMSCRRRPRFVIKCVGV